MNIFYMEQFDRLPVTSDMVKSATRKDPVLSQMHDATTQGWPETALEGALPLKHLLC